MYYIAVGYSQVVLKQSLLLQPKAISHAYSFSTATLTASWSSSQFCAKGDSNSGGGGGSDGDKDDSSKPPPESDEPAKDAPSSSAGSGGWGFFSWLFFLIFSGFALYFAVGMWMRRTQCGFVQPIRCECTADHISFCRRLSGLGHGASPRLLG